MTDQPRTAAGRALYLSGVLQDDIAGARILPAILAIEAEAAALDVERLARALREAGYGVGQPVDVVRLATAYARRAWADEEGTA